VILREAQKYIAPTQFAEHVVSNPRESRLIGEAVNTGISCLGAVISWAAIASGTILVPFSAGASSVIVVVGYAAAGASALQCFNGITRTVLEVARPEGNDWLDSEAWYQNTSTVLDAVSLAGVGASALTTIKLVNVAKAATGKTLREVLRGLNRQERAKLTKELLTINDPRLTSKMLKLKQLSGELPKRFTPTQLKHSTKTQIKDALGATAGLIGSAYTGNVKTIALGLYEEVGE
ncbi:MAG: NAD synthetase, partial [Pseudomonas sp.]